MISLWTGQDGLSAFQVIPLGVWLASRKRGKKTKQRKQKTKKRKTQERFLAR